MISFFRNSREEWIQKCAWRLVRSAEDRMGSGRGAEKLMWAVDRLKLEFPKVEDRAEDYVRAAFSQFQAERRAMVL